MIRHFSFITIGLIIFFLLLSNVYCLFQTSKSIEHLDYLENLLEVIDRYPESRYKSQVLNYLTLKKRLDTSDFTDYYLNNLHKYSEVFLYNFINLKLTEMFSAERNYPQALYHLEKLKNFSMTDIDDKLVVFFGDPLMKKNYWYAYLYLKNRQFTKSIISAQDFIKTSNNSNFNFLAYLIIVESYIQDGKHQNSLNTLEYLGNKPEYSNFAAVIQYKKAYNYEMLRNYEKAIQIYKKIVLDYPFTQYSYSAEARLYDLSFIPGTDVNYSELIVHHSLYGKREIQRAENITKGFYVQVNAFSSKKNAENHKKTLDQSGFRAVIFQREIRDNLLHIVAVGPYSSRAEAVETQNRIKQSLNLDSFIISE